MRALLLLFLFPFFGQCRNYCSSGTYPTAHDTTDTLFCVLSARAARAATLLAQTASYDNAVASIRKAQAIDFKEHVVSFGKDSTGQVIHSLTGTGNINNGYIPAINNRLADIHIHTNEQPPSTGDLYGFIDQITTDTSYIRYIITPMGTEYALVLLNKKEALSFNISYARRAGIKQIQSDGAAVIYQPTFPPQLVDEFNELRSWNHATHEAALAFLLKKYKAGIALLKQNTGGHYTALDVVEKKDKQGDKTYLLSHCP
ncbi:hypothetical protein U0035_07340 [Niabella yanshanensis]|uniref:Uncharacterized protein n=1 Tax=Niabella yanshanensis TaxID=577386 RepID=A0ABZ0WBQ0_9BACT|nr:hypothetical protein [Niabella yanshanensis]WQD39959.1 hypothetical protein U0035_07340 [Niabella yanshanensis]